MTFEIIATGSDGNATVINDCVLIDCGVPYKALKHHVKRLQLVLLTHEHGDHFNPATATRMAQERPALRWACCPWMVEKLIQAGVQRRQIDVLEPGRAAGYISGVVIRPEATQHNVPNCAWKVVFTLRDGPERLFYATDCGTLDGISAKDYDLYMVEANHTRAEIEKRAAEKLAAGEYAYELRAAENHLSLEQAQDWLAQNMGPKSEWVPMHQHKNKGGADHEHGISYGPDDKGPGAAIHGE